MSTKLKNNELKLFKVEWYLVVIAKADYRERNQT